MKPIKRIDEPNCRRYQLDLHTDYLQRLYDVISKIGPEKILLDASDIVTWDTGLKEQGEITREIKASEESESLLKKDEERDQIISALFQDIRSAARSPLPARREAGHKLKLVVDTYKGLQKERWAGETAHIKGLLNDLDKSEYAAAITTVGVAELIQLLRTTNTAFDTLRMARTLTSASKNLPSAAEVRKKNEDALYAILFHIEVAYTMAPTEPERKVIGELIDQINRITHEAKATFNQSDAQRKAAKQPKEPKQPKQPKEPKQPKQPKDPKPAPDPKQPEQPKKPDEKPKDPKKPDDGNPDIKLPEE